MPAIIVASDIIGISTGLSATANNTNYVILSSVTVASTSIDAIYFGGWDEGSVTNMGTLIGGGFSGITVESSLASSSVIGMSILNAATGTIGSTSANLAGILFQDKTIRAEVANMGLIYSINGDGIEFEDTESSSINNSGTILGGKNGITAIGSSNSIVNSGTITINSGEFTGDRAAVALIGAGNGINSLTNSGLIEAALAGSGDAVRVTGFDIAEIINSGTIRSTGESGIDAVGSGAAIRVLNTGTIAAAPFANTTIIATNFGDTIRNYGLIEGGILLNDGDDLFYNFGGTVTGAVFGGLGNDVFYIDNPSTLVVEFFGQGTDRVDAAVSFTLANTGDVENLTLVTNSTATHGTGNSLNNVVSGNELDNRLSGGAGNDQLNGQSGNDSLFGDSNNDTISGGDGDDLLRGGSGVDTLNGGEGDDTIRGDASSDMLNGDAGEDMLIGGTGRDTLNGGADADTFVFRAVTDSYAGANRDVISGFELNVDVIDLARIDANVLVNGNQTFTFIGSTAFNFIAGQLRAVHGVNSVLEADVNGDAVADFELQFNAIAGLNVNDILL